VLGPGKPAAKKKYSEFIDKYKASPDEHVQDQVGAARIRLAYMTTKDKDWAKARKQFKEAAATYKGTGTTAADFGGIKDQALYQAAVCLSADGKKPEARAAYVDFIKTQWMSPLIYACYNRIVKIDGKKTDEIDALLQHSLDRQQKEIRFQMSVCGPKVVAHVLSLEGKGEVDYKLLAKECGTTDTGTTVEGLRKGLRAHGLNYFGFTVSRKDLATIQTPAIFLIEDHYIVATAVHGEVVTAFDPVVGTEREIDYSKVPEDQFNVIALLKAAPEGEK
jgi:hypothetical protein